MLLRSLGCITISNELLFYRDTLTGRGSKGSNLFLPRYLPPRTTAKDPAHLPASRYVKKTTASATSRYGASGGDGWGVGCGRSVVMVGVPNPTFERESPSTQETDEWMTDTGGIPPTATVIRVGGGGDEEDCEDEPYYSQILSHTLPKKSVL